ncbi:MAG: lipid A deacylase LpxR family protein, partial [Chitinophagaceae bacterium]
MNRALLLHGRQYKPFKGFMEKTKQVWLVVFLFAFSGRVAAQADTMARQSAFRVFLDNDFINLRGHGSDQAYTNGIRLDYFNVLSGRRGLFSWMPRAGENSVNTTGVSAMQVMYSPEDLKKRQPDSSDFPYSGGLTASYSLHSSNPAKKFSLRSEITGGVMGPPALGEEMQRMVHRIMGFIEPKGWDYQLKTDLLINVDFTAEKMLHEFGRGAELVGGANASLGSMNNAASVYAIFRAGHINPYFNGFLAQTNAYRGSKKLFYNIIVSPRAELQIYNALVDGGLFRRWSGRDVSKANRPTLTASELNLGIDYGFALSW